MLHSKRCHSSSGHCPPLSSQCLDYLDPGILLSIKVAVLYNVLMIMKKLDSSFKHWNDTLLVDSNHNVRTVMCFDTGILS
ncbi:MAG: hypothetical protein O7198_01625 [Wolbachia endosymbiont of Nomada marshamella]|nr:hypothetical protein [Wolbachia endosymbiont of Nomada marshamella]